MKVTIKRFSLYGLVIILIFLPLTGCNLPSNDRPTGPTQPGAAFTAAARTVAALTTVDAKRSTPAVFPQTTQSPKPAPGLTQAPTVSQPTAIVQATNTCDLAEFVEDVTIPDGATLAPGAVFTKTWRIRNIGTCTWDSNYRLVFENGDAMNGDAMQNLTGTVPPGQTIDLSVKMQAPTDNKEYQGNWKLMNASGTRFGVNTEKGVFWVKIKVSEDALLFAVTSASVKVDNANYSGTCPRTFNFSSDMKLSKGGLVTYYWEYSDGTKTDSKKFEVSSGGTKTITTSRAFSTSGSYWVRLYVDKPNHQYFPKTNFNITCSP